jgi:hypothetical protein
MRNWKNALVFVLAIGFVAGGAVTPARGQCTTWLDGVSPGLTGPVYAMIPYYNGDLIAAGSFSQAGGVSVNNIAKWNGTSWSALGSGLGSGGNNSVYALAVWNGVLYAGGNFLNSGGTTTFYIAYWNGSSWLPTNGELNNPVRALCTCNTSGSEQLYAGGEFNWATNGGTSVPVNYVARYDGATWYGIGTSPNFGTSGTVYALVCASSLYIGGNFYSAGNVAGFNNIAKWGGGGNCQMVGTGTNGPVYSLNADNGWPYVYVGGAFSTAGGISANNVALWQGDNHWEAMGSGMNGTVKALRVHYGVNAGGEFTAASGSPASHIANWTGAAWVPMRSGTDATVNAMVSRGTDLCVGGNFSFAGGRPAGRWARWGVGGVDSTPPTGATATPAVFCLGSSTSLQATGGTLGTGAVVVWYAGSCGGTSVGTGNPLSVSPTVPTTYYARYEGDCNITSCSPGVSVTLGSAPVFGTHPLGATKHPDESVTFTAAASGLGTITYKWQKNNVDISPPATGPSYTINPIAPGDAGDYRCVATSGCGSTNSDPATLTVLSCINPVLTLYSADQCIKLGENLVVQVNLSGPESTCWKIRGGQFRIGFDAGVLSLVSAEPGAPTWGEEIMEIGGAGNLQYAVGCLPPPNDCGDVQGTMATLTFSPINNYCPETLANLVYFLPDPNGEWPTAVFDSNDVEFKRPTNLTANDLPASVKVDIAPPTLTGCPSNISIGTDPNVCTAVVSWIPPTVSDNCTGATLTSTHNPGDTFPKGTTTVTYTGTDTCGNTATCSFTVTVTDDENPVIAGCPSNITTGTQAPLCSAVVSWTAPTATDNCPGVVLTSTHNPGATFPKGITTVTYTATDAAGLTALCSFTVTVNDDDAPVVTCPANLNLFAGLDGCSDTDPGSATALDNCDGVLTPTYVRSDGKTLNEPFCAPDSPITITWTATDTVPNTGTCTQTITVAYSGFFDITVEYEGAGPLPGAFGGTTFTRCITFAVYQAGALMQTVDLLMNFTDGSATGTFTVTNGLYDCITAKDKLHTLRRTKALIGGNYLVSFTGADALVPGNLNDNDYIDIVDFGLWVNRYSLAFSKDTTCSTLPYHPNFNGDNVADELDYSFIQMNFWEYSEALCGPPLPGGPGDGGPITRISVRDLIAQGLGELAILDLNGDRYYDTTDVALWLQGVRPLQKAHENLWDSEESPAVADF